MLQVIKKKKNFTFEIFPVKEKAGSLLYVSFLTVLLLQVLDDPAEDNLHLGMQTIFCSALSLIFVLLTVGANWLPLTPFTQDLIIQVCALFFPHHLRVHRHYAEPHQSTP